ncbi:2-succinyl-5-enolpyruvyl-6-hydroxy-3-cyclohexene-1-carboxylic-acid synthase, partial [Pluralibacter gergoviae]|nr:2-succinyl-5-enolpyruvyl-6-hydroxy-3-cyclohexene-1-carboxylate synthase [Pluralibacter gergoviae]
AHAAQMFGLGYARPESWQQLDEVMSAAWRRPATTVVELVVNDTDGAQLLQQLLAQVSQL